MPAHPARDQLVGAVREWYRTSRGDLGLEIQERAYGYYARPYDQILVERLAPGQEAAFLRDLRAYFGGASVRILVDHPALEAPVARAVLGAGGRSLSPAVFLAHAGEVPAVREVPGLTIEDSSPEHLREYARVKLKGFSDSEEEPPRDLVEEEWHLRRREALGPGRFLLARVGREAAGVIGWYAGTDAFMFQAATRLPFRKRGIERRLITEVLARSAVERRRSVMLNANPDDWPIQFYRRLGFVDLDYRQARFEWPGWPPHDPPPGR